MSNEASGLSRTLNEITFEFFRAKLSLTPEKVEVFEQEGGTSVIIRVEGFLTKGEAALAKRPEHQEILRQYYARVLEPFSPILSVVLEEVAKRPLLECWTALDLSRNECLYVLTLGTPKRDTGVPLHASGIPKTSGS